jgi:hypothetical protein
VESTTRGDPESPLLWTARSLRNLVDTLATQGHTTSSAMVARLLKNLGYSPQANRKRLEGAQHPDRDAQFEHIGETIRRQLEANQAANCAPGATRSRCRCTTSGRTKCG